MARGAGAAGGNAGMREREDQLGTLRAVCARVRDSGQGGVVLVPGEAGIGKTTLLRHFADGDNADDIKVFWTACEPLSTPRPFGPLLDLGAAISTGLEAQIAASGGPFDAAMALTRALRQQAPAILIIEDLHWADQATLDAVRAVARRIGSVPVLMILSYRDDLDRTDPLRVLLGDLAGPGLVLARLTLPGLTVSAISSLSGARHLDARELHARTNGNPFFVTEVLAGDSDQIPATVRDAVLARAARLSGPARDLLDAAAVVPGRVDVQLLADLDPAAVSALDECLAAGILIAADGQATFRHEIARQVIEESLPAGRRAALHRRALALLEGNERHPGDPATLVHHADAAGDQASVLRYAAAAGGLAAAAGAHREAAELYRRALAAGPDLAPGKRADLLERFAAESYMAALGPEAITALREARDIYQASDDVLSVGRVLRQLARHYGRGGQLAEALASVRESVAMLEQLPPTPELALAYVNLSASLAMMRHPETATVARKGVELGRETGCAEAVYDGLNNIGSLEILLGDTAAGLANLERSLELAEQARDSLGVARAYMHLCWMLAMRREWLLAEPYFAPALGYLSDHGHELWHGRVRSLYMEALFARCRWDEAADAANAILADSDQLAPVERCGALRVQASIRARRGDRDYWLLLDEAGELTKLGAAAVMLAPVAGARAEAAWLEGRTADVLAEVALAADGPGLDPLASLDLLCWRQRAGGDTIDSASLPEPYRAFLSGDRRSAARWWEDRGCPYDGALALIGSGDMAALLSAADVLRGLGALPALAIAVRELRALGVTQVPSAPRRARPPRAAGLTDREVDVLRLIAVGQRNTDIAAALFVSSRTVDHHVSAILKKLGVRSRSEAVSIAVRLGLIQV